MLSSGAAAEEGDQGLKEQASSSPPVVSGDIRVVQSVSAQLTDAMSKIRSKS